MKEIGQPASLTNAAQQPIVEFVVSKIERKPKCDAEFATDPENGKFLAVKMDIQTHKELGAEEFIEDFYADANSWTYISPEGTTFNGSLSTGASYSCMKESKTLPASIGPAQKVSGWVVLDVPKAEGTLVFDPYHSGGWEWEIVSEQPNA